MIRSILLSCAALLLTVPGSAEVRTYGDGAGTGELVPIAEITADPDAWAGREVRVQGVIQDVCPKAGCWMELRDAADHRIRIKVDDNVIVFPVEAKGLEATAHGVVKVHDLSREDYVGWMAHLAEERGEAFDPESVGEGPYRLVQIRGAGATIGAPD